MTDQIRQYTISKMGNNIIPIIISSNAPVASKKLFIGEKAYDGFSISIRLSYGFLVFRKIGAGCNQDRELYLSAAYV
jgi:hypothetical protein